MNAKNQPEINVVAKARELKYLIDEGFYDEANKDTLNYIGSLIFKLDHDTRKKLKYFGRKIAKLAGVSQHIGESTFLNISITEYLIKHGYAKMGKNGKLITIKQF